MMQPAAIAFHPRRMHIHRSLWLSVFATAVLAGACVPPAAGPTDELGEHTELVPDADFHGCAVMAISEEEAAGQQRTALAVAARAPIVVFLNKNGGTYSPGANDSRANTSSIIGRTYNIPAFRRGDAKWTSLVSCVREQFSRFNVSVVDVEPTAGNYIEAVVSGHPSHIGLSSGIGGIAPIDTYGCRPIERAVAYVFEQNLGNDQNLCEITAHEVGHTLSLEHEYKCEDPMTYLYGCGNKTFQDSNQSCGTYSAERCSCRGGTQNTVRALLDLLGPSTGEPLPDPSTDREPPSVALTEPADGAVFRENQPLTVIARATDDQRLARVELIWDYNGETYLCPSTSQYVDCTQSGDVHTWTVRAGTGPRTFRVRAADLAGREATTETRTIQLTADGTPPAAGDRTPPSITLVAPNDQSSVRPRSRIEVIAEVSDDTAVDKAQLLWAFNNLTYACPTNERYVTCAVEGSRMRWSVEVNVEGARAFSVRAYDAAGNEATTPSRTVRVENIADATPPAIRWVEPANGARLPSGSEVLVVAEVRDEGAVTAAELVWDFNRQRYPCPLASQYVDCAIENSRYTWRVRVSEGARTFRITATDSAGNTGTSEDRAFTLE